MCRACCDRTGVLHRSGIKYDCGQRTLRFPGQNVGGFVGPFMCFSAVLDAANSLGF